MSTDLRFDWITTDEGLYALRDDWTRLAGDALGVFRSWEWQATWWRTLGRDGPRRRSLRVLVARDAGGVRAILPMYVEEPAVGKVLGRRTLRLLADCIVGSDYLGVVARPEDVRALGPTLVRHAVEDLGGRVKRVRFDDVSSDEPLVGGLANRRFRRIEQEERFVCPFQRIEGTFAAYLASRPKGFGAQLRRRRRWLEREHGSRVEVLRSPADVAAALDPMFRLHEARWAADGGSKAIPDGRVQRFHRVSAALLAERGWVRLAVLRVDGTAVASAYGFACGRRHAFYQGGLDPAWRPRSVGTVVLGALIETAFDEGADEYDLLRGDEPYKRIWADEVRVTRALRADDGGLGDRLGGVLEKAEVLLRRRAAERLPAPVVAALRNAMYERLYG